MTGQPGTLPLAVCSCYIGLGDWSYRTGRSFALGFHYVYASRLKACSQRAMNGRLMIVIAWYLYMYNPVWLISLADKFTCAT